MSPQKADNIKVDVYIATNIDFCYAIYICLIITLIKTRKYPLCRNKKTAGGGSKNFMYMKTIMHIIEDTQSKSINQVSQAIPYTVWFGLSSYPKNETSRLYLMLRIIIRIINN